MLIRLQYAGAWMSMPPELVQKLVKSEPKLLFYEGEFLRDEMKRDQVATDEVLAAIRSEGLSDLGLVQAVVLEANGTFAVVWRQSADPQKSALANLKRFAE